MGDIQAKRLITWRVDPDLLGRIDGQARTLGWSRAAFLVWAAENALGDAQGGVPDPPAEVRAAGGSKAPLPPRAQDAPAEDGPREWARARQEKLNAAKYGGKR